MISRPEKKYRRFVLDKTPNGCAVKVMNLNLSIHGNSILNGVNFQVGYGDKVALIGSSGSGKHSLFKVLLDLYQPDYFNSNIKSSILGVNSQGWILDEDRQKYGKKSSVHIYNRPTSEYHPMELRLFVTNLDRDSFVFEGTLLDNVDPDRLSSQSEVIAALKHFDLIGYIVKAGRVRSFNGIRDYFEGLDIESLEEQDVSLAKLGDEPVNANEDNPENHQEVAETTKNDATTETKDYSGIDSRSTVFFQNFLIIKATRQHEKLEHEHAAHPEHFIPAEEQEIERIGSKNFNPRSMGFTESFYLAAPEKLNEDGVTSFR